MYRTVHHGDQQARDSRTRFAENPMKARIVYESIFGNTALIAAAVCEGLSGMSMAAVELVEVDTASSDLSGVDLLVVGGPTHMGTMSRANSRNSGRQEAARLGVSVVSCGRGVREWLNTLSPVDQCLAAAFDTGAESSGGVPTGSAAQRIAGELVERGFRLMGEPERFIIRTENRLTTLKTLEVPRARAWGAMLGLAANRATAATRKRGKQTGSSS